MATINYRNFKDYTVPEQDTLKKAFSEDTKNVYDYMLALGFIPLIVFLIFLSSFWYIGLILSVIAFVFLQLFYSRKVALWLLKVKRTRGYFEKLIKKEIAAIEAENHEEVE